jgi:predicted house-cleaning NTP pyrophosphatase (Maf/HAM1 superfamily)
MTIEELYKMNGLTEDGEDLSSETARKKNLSDFGLDPNSNYNDCGEPMEAAGSLYSDEMGEELVEDWDDLG